MSDKIVSIILLGILALFVFMLVCAIQMNNQTRIDLYKAGFEFGMRVQGSPPACTPTPLSILYQDSHCAYIMIAGVYVDLQLYRVEE